MAPKKIRKMQVAAYLPVLAGYQLLEKRGVVVEVKKVIIIDDIGIMRLVVGESISMTISMLPDEVFELV